MRSREKLAAIFAAILVFSGLILISRSQIYVAIQDESNEENGIVYEVKATGTSYVANGTSLTRYYSRNPLEEISLEVKTRLNWPAVPDLLPVHFTIIAPSGKETIIIYWLDYTTHPGGINRAIDFEVVKIDGLTLANISKKKFIGEPMEDGNYTLVYTEWTVPIRYLALTKITLEKEYPYTFGLPLGVSFVIIGGILAVWVIKSSRRSKLKKRWRVKGRIHVPK